MASICHIKLDRYFGITNMSALKWGKICKDLFGARKLGIYIRRDALWRGAAGLEAKSS
jgi:hypothetical protein